MLFLPHGYEGAGPEHSSARLERYLQLCAESNMQVCVPSTPAQMFHMLRRQMLQPFRKPLIVMTPKSLLRHELSVSSLEDLTRGGFARVIAESDDLPAPGVRRVVFCSGKVYFDLLKARRKDGIRDVALVRIEQLYPFPTEDYEAVVARYPNAREVVWCQEEPQNQGAWYQIRHRLQEPLGQRRTCSTPAARRPRRPPPGSARFTRPSSSRSSMRRCMPRRRRIRRETTTTSHAGCRCRDTAQKEDFMTTEIRVPQLPESITDATLVAWHKKPGDAVKRDENLADLETDKVVLEVPAPANGVLREVKVPTGAVVTAGQLLALIEEGAQAAATACRGESGAAGRGARRPPARMPAKSKLSPSVRRLVEENRLDRGRHSGAAAATGA